MSLPTVPPGVPAAGDLPEWVPDEATLNRLAGEFFAALPGAGAPGTSAAPANPVPPAPGGVAQAPRVDVPARASDVPQVPGDSGSVAPAGELTPPPFGLATPLPSAGVPGVPSLLPEPPAPVPTPSTPYYFLAETSPYGGSAGGGLESLVDAALRSVEVQPPRLQPASGATGGRRSAAGEPADRGGLGELPSPPAGLVPPVFYFVDRPANGGAPEQAPYGSGRPAPFDIHRVRRDFPILSEQINGKPLVWLDNAATTQKPQAVLDRLAHFYAHENSNIHRAAHELAARATDAYEGARKTVARFIGAQSEKDIIFVRGATEAINLVAKTWGKANIRRGDEIILSHLEHHANIVPWQMLAAETGAKLRIIPVDATGQLIMSEYGRLLSDKTKLVAVSQVSNALGTVTPVQQVIEMGHRAGACVLIDGAQSVPHLRVNMQTLGADFFVFSGHKIFGPTGIGVLYGRQEVVESMPPWEGGGNMIVDVTFEKTSYQKPPGRFEAGTGNIADAVGLGAALDYVSRLGLEAIAEYEHALVEYATPRMCAVPGLRMIGTASAKASVLSFVLDGYRTEEVGSALNQQGIAVRSGHHCAQPILRRFGLETTVRPSVAFYNTFDEIDLLVSVLHRLAAARGLHS